LAAWRDKRHREKNMRLKSATSEFVVQFSFPKGRRDTKNHSAQTECTILVGPLDSRDAEKTNLCTVKVRRDTRDKCNLVVAREYALKKALDEAQMSSADKNFIWQNRLIRKANCFDTDLTF